VHLNETITFSQLASLGSATAHKITTHYTDSIIHSQTLVPCVIQTRTVCRPRLVSLSRSLFLLPHSEQLANVSALLLSSVLQKNDCVYERAQHMDWDLTHGSHTDIVQLCWLAAY